MNVSINAILYVTLRLIAGAESDESSDGVGVLAPLH